MRLEIPYPRFTGLFILTVFLVIPLLLDSYFVHVLISILLLCYMAACWNIIGGYGGQILLGQQIFFAIGAYTSSLLFVKIGLNPWIGMLLGGFIAAIFGYLLGFVFLNMN